MRQKGFDWFERRVDRLTPERRAIAESMYASVYASAYATALVRQEFDSAGNPRSYPAESARLSAERAVEDWIKIFQPDAFPDPPAAPHQ
jgi:hypothetical protein